MYSATSGGFVVAIALMSALISFDANADKTYYRWLDDRGNPVHSDRPPSSGVDYEVVSTKTTMIRRVDGEEGAVPAETTPRVGNEFDAVDEAKENQEVVKNPENCKRARENLQSLETSARIRMRDDKGEYRFLTTEEIDAQKEKARDIITVHCE